MLSNKALQVYIMRALTVFVLFRYALVASTAGTAVVDDSAIEVMQRDTRLLLEKGHLDAFFDIATAHIALMAGDEKRPLSVKAHHYVHGELPFYLAIVHLARGDDQEANRILKKLTYDLEPKPYASWASQILTGTETWERFLPADIQKRASERREEKPNNATDRAKE